MAKRKKREQAAETNGDLSSTKYTSRLFEDGQKLREIRNACGHLKRVAHPGPSHLQKFIDRVFAIAGVAEETEQAEAHTE